MRMARLRKTATKSTQITSQSVARSSLPLLMMQALTLEGVPAVKGQTEAAGGDIGTAMLSAGVGRGHVQFRVCTTLADIAETERER